ncbi:MAG: AMP nucleosidase [Caulobacterales bacterium]|nr:AMP nucleosidase [Caulobacterales bacterium]
MTVANDPFMLTDPSAPARDLVECATPEAAFERLDTLYQAAVANIQERFEAYAAGRPAPADDPVSVYPYLFVEIAPEYALQTSKLVMGRITSSSFHGSTISSPRLFKDYLLEQLTLLKERYDATVSVGRSTVNIPLTFAMESAAAGLSGEQRQNLQSHFDLPNLVAINDAVVDGRSILERVEPFPLALFSAERIDYSLHRLRHYTATSAEHFQRFVLFTNYQRYVDEFVAYGREEVRRGAFEKMVEPGDRVTTAKADPSDPPLKKLPQMPAYHLTRPGRAGVTLVNIGVGPSNAKTMTDHLAVLRPHVWLMVGHCAGLRRSQRLGDYVLAHAYLRDDNVLDRALPNVVPLPTIAEVQLALSQAVGEATGLDRLELKKHLRTGTVVTTDDRNWELRFEELAEMFNHARAIAIDMESATIAANGYRYRVPYGTLLCVSDRPLHGEIKLPGMADAFYEERISQHLQIGLQALELLRKEAEAGTLHSRKLRSFDEPLFR